jgi:hypothetical protein
MNYQIVKDEELLKRFIDWLPELQDNEMYYVSLFARKKHYNVLPSDKSQLKRFTSTKDMLFSKIKQLECEIGCYKYYDIVIPNDALSLYISPNPRNLEKATQKAIVELQKLSWKKYNGYNPQSEVLSAIQVSGGTTHFFDFDFDHVDLESTLKEIDKLIPGKYTVLQTKGGFHILVEVAKLTPREKKIYYQISKLPGADVRGEDNLMPVVGCTQGGFVPTLFKPKYEHILS